jgi:prepilin-type N-terminal cleavage/methylation domain-containing protein
MMKRGFTLVETVVGVAIFLIIALGIYQGFFFATRAVSLSRSKTEAALLATEQFELIRNLPYQSVGIVGGLPAGVLTRDQSFNRGGIVFNTTLSIRSIDDPFDGTISGTPNDTAPADYKEASLSISCVSCVPVAFFDFATTIAPRNVENSTNNGALFLRVIDAGGLPVPLASIHVRNDQVTPVISFDETTDNNGQLQLVDVPPGTNAYQVSVTKVGYSTDQTASTTESNPNPAEPQFTVASGQVTFGTLKIDRLSDLRLIAYDEACAPLANVAFSLTGSKLVGVTPDIYKYESSFTTDSSGRTAINNLEWDNYTPRLTGTTYSLAGITSALPLALLPDTEQDVSLILASHAPRVLLVFVRDAATGLPLAEATTTLSLAATPLSEKSTSPQADCWPVGQAWFGGLSAGVYELKVERDGYQTYLDGALIIADDWSSVTVPLQSS